MGSKLKKTYFKDRLKKSASYKPGDWEKKQYIAPNQEVKSIEDKGHADWQVKIGPKGEEKSFGMAPKKYREKGFTGKPSKLANSEIKKSDPYFQNLNKAIKSPSRQLSREFLTNTLADNNISYAQGGKKQTEYHQPEMENLLQEKNARHAESQADDMWDNWIEEQVQAAKSKLGKEEIKSYKQSIIGYTKSKKPVYSDWNHPAHNDFTRDERGEAAKIHSPELDTKSKELDKAMHPFKAAAASMALAAAPAMIGQIKQISPSIKEYVQNIPARESFDLNRNKRIAEHFKLKPTTKLTTEYRTELTPSGKMKQVPHVELKTLQPHEQVTGDMAAQWDKLQPGSTIGAAKNQLEKSKNVREQKKKVFGTSPMPTAESPMRQKVMDHVIKWAQKRYNMPIERSPGKLNAAGKIIDKPAMSQQSLQHIGNPASLIHELAHIENMKESGMPPDQFQKWMDKRWAEINQQYGYKQQAREAEEYEAHGAENKIRRQLGLPAHPRPTKEPGKKRLFAADKPDKQIAMDVPHKGGTRRITGLSSNLDARKPKFEERQAGLEEFGPKTGWKPSMTPDALINRRAMGDVEGAKKLAGQKYFRQKLRKLKENKVIAPPDEDVA